MKSPRGIRLRERAAMKGSRERPLADLTRDLHEHEASCGFSKRWVTKAGLKTRAAAGSAWGSEMLRVRALPFALFTSLALASAGGEAIGSPGQDAARRHSLREATAQAAPRDSSEVSSDASSEVSSEVSSRARSETTSEPPRVRVQAHALSESDVQTFRAIRSAEVANDAASLEVWTRDSNGAAVVARARLALESVRQRSTVRTVAEAVAAEREIERRRDALLAELARSSGKEAPSPERALMRELTLESAEDLLLRLHAAHDGDATVSIGLPSAAELRDAQAVLAAVEHRLGSPGVVALLAPESAIATDAAVFRAHALRGLAESLAADLSECAAEGLGAERDAAARERGQRARSEAQRLLARAGLCELPVPPALGEILALAQGRAERDPALRGRLLARAADSADPAIALVANVVRWQDAGARGPFPGPDRTRPSTERLERLAYAAELRSLARSGGPAEAIGESLSRALRRAAAESADATESLIRMRASAEWFAERLPPAVAELAMRADATPALLAVASLRRDAGPLLDLHPDLTVRAVRDPLTGPLLALRVAERFAARGEARAAATTIVDAVRAFRGLPAAREALRIALDLLRREGDGAARLLEEALELAEERFGNAHGAEPGAGLAGEVGDAAAWRLERVDLALFGPDESRDLERAEELLDSLPSGARDSIAEASVRLRRLELGYVRTREGRDARTESTRAKRQARLVELDEEAAELDVHPGAIAAAAATTPLLRALPARLSTVRAEIALEIGEAPKSRLLAERVLGDALAEDRTLLRAAKAWIGAAIFAGEPMTATGSAGGDAKGAREVAAPKTLGDFAARSASYRAWLREPLGRVVEDLEASYAEGAPRRLPPDSVEIILSLIVAPGILPEADALRARALDRLAGGDSAGAARSARDVLSTDPDDRVARWILAESLRAGVDEQGRLEAFTHFRTLAPIGSSDRDRFWWRAQAAQLEMLVDAPERGSREADIVARVNRLAALDATLGGPALAKRFEAVREKALAAGASRSAQREDRTLTD